jgi:hypothetical protein
LAICDAAAPAEECGPGTTLEGVWVTEATDEICNVEGITTFVCPDESQIPGAIVTDLDLCNLVTEDFKGCNTCVLFGVGGVDGTNAFNLIGGINDFTLGEQVGAEALCELEGDELIAEYTDIVEATVSGGSNQQQAITLFTDCVNNLEANNLAGFSINNNGLSINSNGQIEQTSNTQSIEQMQALNQTTEQNKNVETTSNDQVQQQQTSDTLFKKQVKAMIQDAEQNKNVETTSNDQVQQQQTSNTQSNEQVKALNQDVEQNKNVEQKKSTTLPLFNFNHQ